MSPERYLQAFRTTVDAPVGSRERNLDAIERRLGEGDVVDEEQDDDARAPVQPRGRWTAALFLFKAVSLSVGLGVAGLGAIKVGAMTWSAVVSDEARPAAVPEPERDEMPARPRRAAVRSPAATPAANVEPAPVPAVVATSEPTPTPPRATRPRAKTPTSDRLREEVDLLTRVRAELDADRHDGVLALVAEHERRFPDGAMIEERRAWRAIATCSLGRANARTEAQSFLTRHPRSALAEKVRRACSDHLTDPATRSD
jgi:hypothetical protein